jgi:DNA-binding NtrC family response regulator
MRRLRILLVDDEAALRAAVRRIVESAGHSVVEAASVRAAMGLLESEFFDAVLTDLVMPEASGIDLLQALRQRWPGIPGILMTGSRAFEALSEAVRAGATDILAKPTRAAELIDALGRCANRLYPGGALETAAAGHRKKSHRRWVAPEVVDPERRALWG